MATRTPEYLIIAEVLERVDRLADEVVAAPTNTQGKHYAAGYRDAIADVRTLLTRAAIAKAKGEG